ncbi:MULTISPECIES: DUF411 domain-containing protein [unclassified Aliihoeflea]|jgi:hypothetical protein|uniref:DUF411 domain-containing protein n=1 Tax=unclassified Aliihoeflea TaxID=2628764 RepID=UPI00046798D3|nr:MULTISPECIES: DUF411 domain-containing protein [unclassified Aliihoeflea]MCO6388916.1 DUF411 domain-containing protein [Aliihoeflea sp. 40Bstr573]
MSIFRIPLAAAALFALTGIAAAEALTFDLARTQSCGCCLAYAKRLEDSGHVVQVSDLPMASLMQMKNELGVPAELAGCHTSKVGNYVIEGHVPAADVERLVSEAPDAVGLAVAGMPVGSPGMEYGDRRDAYDVTLIHRDGSTSVYNSYPAKD